MSGSKVLDFLDEALQRRRPAPPDTGPGAKRQKLLPLYLYLDHGTREAKEQLLWKLGDTKMTPAAVARAFCSQLAQPAQLEKEASRVQKELERQLEAHRDLPAAPPSPTLVKLELRVTLHQVSQLCYDRVLWDLGAPRAACEAYAAQVCNELGLDWQAHQQITRKMKDTIDAALRDYAAGRIQAVEAPRGAAILRPPTSRRLPELVDMSEEQKQRVREHLAAVRAARPGQQQQQSAAQQQQQGGTQQSTAQQEEAAPAGPPTASSAAAVTEAPAAVKEEQQGPAASEQTSGADMPDLPSPDD